MEVVDRISQSISDKYPEIKKEHVIFTSFAVRRISRREYEYNLNNNKK
jgi:hypothetical protein